MSARDATAFAGADTADWLVANQRRLVAELARVRVALERHATGGPLPLDRPDPASESGMAGTADLPAPLALERLVVTFGLSPFERDVLLLCAGMEFDAGFASLCASAQADPGRPYPTLGLALAALADAHWSALAPDAPLRHWRLIEVVPGGEPLTRSPIRIDERVLHFLAGVHHLDERLAAIARPVIPGDELVPSHQQVVDRIVAAWSRAAGGPLPAVVLTGSDASGKRAVAAAAGAALGLQVFAAGTEGIPATPGELDALARLWDRESALAATALLLDCEHEDDGGRADAVARLIERLQGPLLVARRDRPVLPQRPVIHLEVPKPTPAEQRGLWRAVLGPAAAGMNGRVDGLATQFSLSGAAIRSAGTEAVESGTSAGDEGLADAAWAACRTLARPRLDDLAQRIEPATGWHDLVLPEPQQRTLREIVAHVRRRAMVYEAWGFAATGSRGLGISALFAGASGTGKTLAAEVLAHELRLDLYRIDLSQVVSKYIGETEKNLRRVFDAAEEGGAVLLFDEADALFGKRSEVKDSHDRYANIEVSYLLQRMESYRGLAILTTNLKSALDTAFLRRIRFVVPFPFPDLEQRTEIWRRVFPMATPTEGLDAVKLAHLNVAGGNIRNIALGAAFLAADAGEPVRMLHLLHAARTEYAKLEKPLTETEIEDWV